LEATLLFSRSESEGLWTSIVEDETVSRSNVASERMTIFEVEIAVITTVRQTNVSIDFMVEIAPE